MRKLKNIFLVVLFAACLCSCDNPGREHANTEPVVKSKVTSPFDVGIFFDDTQKIKGTCSQKGRYWIRIKNNTNETRWVNVVDSCFLKIELMDYFYRVENNWIHAIADGGYSQKTAIPGKSSIAVLLPDDNIVSNSDSLAYSFNIFTDSFRISDESNKLMFKAYRKRGKTEFQVDIVQFK